jgi:hypothetical protein
MSLCNGPERDDVIIRAGGSNASPAYVLRSASGSDQLAYTTRAEAEKVARAYAEHARVNVWLPGAGNEFTFLVGFRGSERTTPQRSAGALHGQPPQSPRTARTDP